MFWGKPKPLVVEPKSAACIECGVTGHWLILVQQMDIDQRELAIRTERVIAACGQCKQASIITRDSVTRYKGDGERRDNGPPADPAAQESDTDLPRSFTGQR